MSWIISLNGTPMPGVSFEGAISESYNASYNGTDKKGKKVVKRADEMITGSFFLKAVVGENRALFDLMEDSQGKPCSIRVTHNDENGEVFEITINDAVPTSKLVFPEEIKIKLEYALKPESQYFRND